MVALLVLVELQALVEPGAAVELQALVEPQALAVPQALVEPRALVDHLELEPSESVHHAICSVTQKSALIDVKNHTHLVLTLQLTSAVTRSVIQRA